jgi:hypothetical protein
MCIAARPMATRPPGWITVALLLGATVSAWASEGSRVVYYGWNNPSSIYVRQHSQKMEQVPLDGTAISIPIDRAAWQEGRRDWSNQFGWFVFGPRRFAAADFATTIAELRATPWRRFTENLLTVVPNTSSTAEGFSWFDDARWETITRNWVVLLKIAKRARCRGIVLDPEDYGGGLFDASGAAARHPARFDEYEEIARRRGRQLMLAGRRVFPEMVVLGLYGPSLPLDVAERDVPASRYGLYAAFVDGLIEGGGVGFRFVDGGEYAYAYKDLRQFRELRATMESRVARRPALSPTSRRRLRFGFGLWLDRGGKGHWFPDDPSRNWFTPAGFAHAIAAAVSAADGYVWIYSHQAGFFPVTQLSAGYVEALESALGAARSVPPRASEVVDP